MLPCTIKSATNHISNCPNRQWIEESLQKAHVPGAAIVVLNATDVVYELAVGYQSLSPQQPMNVNKSIFPLASIAKTFIATAVMQLVEEELVDLDTDVNVAYPAGLLRMSAGTLSIYLRMFLNNGLPVLRPQSIAAMRTIVGGGVIPSYDPQWSNKSMELPPSQGFGLSWYWETMKDGRRYIGHSVNMNFIPPNTKLIAEALGDISQLPRDMQMAVTNKLHESFQPVPIPNHGDWLRYHEEKGQTLKAFEQTTSKAVPHSTFNTIYIQPVGSFNHPRAAPLNVIIQFARIFFAGCEVELLPTIDFSKDMKYRENHGIKQYRTDDFYNYLSQTRYFRDTSRELLCVAVTMTDIYPDESWNFVYGEARVKDGLGVYSFARLDPLFSESSQILLSVPLTKEERIVMLRHCIKILLHELGHLFGLNHCIYFICLMNGANNQIEMDRQTLYLCPVCLRKLYSTLYFDVRHMYENFVYLCEIYGLEEERLWYRKRLNCI
ncbi:unnamed protein product [Rotaria sordida]|uniref:Beta-lactamase-related domain-containing protein n=1 Tax=Rotaria sordida TaxID=392033 RepID=A0A815RSG5_9BILA|nr:unnamed protein product [Rotaria sordida]